MADFTLLKTVTRPRGDVTYAEMAWVPGEAIRSQVTAASVVVEGQYLSGSPSGDVDTFNWMVRALSVGEPPLKDKLSIYDLNILRERAGLHPGPTLRRARRAT